MIERRASHKVVINHEEQYAVWPVGVKVPAGWNDVGKRGSAAECAAYVDAKAKAGVPRP